MKRFYIILVGLLLGLGAGTYAQNTWYTLASGDWDNADIWTLDPAGAVPVSSAVPSAGDNIVILSGKTVTVPDGKAPYDSPVRNITLNSGAVTINGQLDLRTSTGHIFTELKGSGRLLMAADNYPTINDDSDFISRGEGAGTVVFYGNDFSMSASHTFFNLEVDMNSGQTLSLDSDLSLNGSLVVSGGNLGINNGGTISRSVTVNGDVIVQSAGGITVGMGDAFHWLNVYGDFTNNGTVDFSNSAQYTEADNGAVKLKFLGASDNEFVCNGTTDLYRLFLNKGTDKTFKLGVTADINTNFSLYGPVSGATTDATDGAAGWQKAPVVIENGTLELGSNIVITRLAENLNGDAPNEFTIPETGRLWINGASVTTGQSGTVNQSNYNGLSLYGILKVSAGSLTCPQYSRGVSYYTAVSQNSTIEIEGGSINTPQLVQIDAGATFVYRQSGGKFNINSLSEDQSLYPSFDIPETNSAFEMSNGSIIFSQANGTVDGDFKVLVSSDNHNVTGGRFEIQTLNKDFKLNATVPFDTLMIVEGTGTNQVVNTNADGVQVLSDLTIGLGTTFNDGGYNVSIGGDFNIAGTFTQSGNLVFNGAQDGVINNTTGSAVSLPGLHIFKERHETLGQYYKVSLTGTDNIIIDGTLKLSRGALDVVNFTPQVTDSVVIENGDLTSSGTGGLELTGASKQVLKGARGKDYNFGRLILNNSFGASDHIILNSDIDAEEIIFSSNQIVNLAGYNMTVSGSVSTNTTWGANCMFRTSDSPRSSDGGLTLNFTIPAGVTGTHATYPIGTDQYSPCVVKTTSGNSVDASGSFTVVPINTNHPSTDPNKTNDVIPYYWKTRVSGFDALDANKIRLEFTSNNNLKNLKGAFLNGYDWQVGDYKYGNKETTLIFDGTPNYGPYPNLINSDYTAGLDNGNGKIPISGINVYYSNGGEFWHNSTWRDQDGNTSVGPPGQSDISVIEAGDVITIVADNAFASQTEINGTLKVAHGTTGHTIDIVKGTGRLIYENNSTTATNYTHISGDHSEFCNNTVSIIEYTSASGAGPHVIPDDANVPYYSNLVVSETSGTTQTTNTMDLVVNGDLTVESGSFFLDGSSDEFVSVGGDVIINTGTLTYEPLGNRYMDVDGNITFNGAGTFDATPGGSENYLYLDGKIDLGDFGALNFGATGRLFTVYFQGDALSTYSSGGSVADFYRVLVNKTSGGIVRFDSDFNLNASNAGAMKSLHLISGECHLNNALIDINLTTGGNDFVISSASNLHVTAGTVNASGNSGVKLDGSLIIDGGTANIDGTLANNTVTSNSSYIEFTSSGNANIEVTSLGILNVGDQIRRSTNTDEGVLTFTQEGGTVNVGTVGADIKNTRGMFEILGTGSSFSQNGVDDVIAIQRSNGSATVPSLYFNPATTTFASGAGFTFDVSAVTAETIGVYALKPLNDVTITGGTASGAGSGNEVKLLTNEHTISGNLSIGANTTFNTNGLDLILNGNMTNNGIFFANNNTTYFTGTTDQTITGATTFANLSKQIGNENLILANDVTVAKDLTLSSGTLNTDINALTVYGDVVNGVTTASTDPGEGVVMAGSDIQQISGSGSYATLTINNGNGVVLPTQSGAINFTNKLRMVNGVFDIGRNLLILDKTANIEAVNPFSSTNMIQTNLSFTDNGIEKVFPVISASTQFVYPIGSLGKYTPVVMYITGNGNNTGSIRVKAADEHHISVTDRSETTYDDTQNVLQYNWTLDADGIGGFSASVVMQGDVNDIEVTDGNVASDYITANILLGSTEWNKYSNEDFDELTAELTFTFSGTDDIGIDGDYTAGIADAIPDIVPAFITVTNGAYSSISTWATYDPSTGTTGVAGVNVPAGGPRGSIIYVDHTLSFPDNFEAAYRTHINTSGVVDVGTSIGHRLGDVFGTGILKIRSGDLPAGSYKTFFSPSGGILEYTGSTNYDVLSEIPNVNSVVFSGTGTRSLPNIDVQLYGDLIINGPDVKNTHYNNLSIMGDIIFDAGSFDAGTAVDPKVPTITLNGDARQSISGTLEFTTSSAFYNLEVDNSSGVVLQANVAVDNDLLLTTGKIITSSTSVLTINNTAIDAVIGGSASSFVDGPMRKKINESSSFEFPVGDASRYGNIVVSPVLGSGGYWQTQYHNSSAQAITKIYGEGVEWVSNNEYWEVTAPSTGLDANVTMRFDGQSGVSEDNALIVESESIQWDNVPATVNAGYGTITTNGPINYTTFKYLSFGVASIAPYTWEGGDATNPTDWFTSGNWSSGLVPAAANPAIIDGTSGNNPVIDAGDAFCDVLTIASGKNVTVKAGSSLEVGSDLHNSGLIVLESTNAALSSLMLPETMTTKGEVNVKLTLDPDHYWYMSSPIKNAVAGWYKPADDVNKDYVYVFEVLNNRWQWIRLNQTDVTNNRSIGTMQGVAAYYYTTTKILDYTGEVYNTDVTITPDDLGYHLVGNPFPTAIDWEDPIGWTRTGFSNTIWSWINDGGFRVIQTYNNNGDDLPGVWVLEPDGYNSATMSHIPPYQSVWMKQDVAGAMPLTVKRSARVKKSSAPLKSTSRGEKSFDLIRISVANDYTMDAAVLYFNEQFIAGKSNEDSEKRFNGSTKVPEIYTRINNQAMAINGQPVLTGGGQVFPLSVRNRIEGEVTLKVDLTDFHASYDVSLEDKATGSWVNLREVNEYAYLPLQMGDDHDRFVLHFGRAQQVATNVAGQKESNANHINVIGRKDHALVQISSDLLQTSDAVIEVLDINGRLISSVNTKSSETEVELPDANGVYMVRVNAGGVVKTEKVAR